MANVPVFSNFQIFKLEEINSTNLYAEKLLSEQLIPEGSIIYSLNQTAGIGHAENKWESEPDKNLTASVILNPTYLNASDQFFLTIILALSVCDTVDFFLEHQAALIKWPNDIYLRNRKVAGLLIKNHIIGSSISVSIAGLGLNINQTLFKNAPLATSLKEISGREYDIHEVLTKWHMFLANYYQRLEQEPSNLMDEYLSKLYLKGQSAEFVIQNKTVEASIQGVDKYGLLQLTDRNGRKYSCGLKEIVFPVIG